MIIRNGLLDAIGSTPLIKLFSFGLPGVASIDAGMRFGLDASLSAGVKVGILGRTGAGRSTVICCKFGTKS